MPLIIKYGSDLGFAKIYYHHDRIKTEWIKYLRSRGVDAAHPNDGWVDRSEKSFKLCYPQFADKLGNQLVGCVVALGDYYGQYRLVRVVAVYPTQCFYLDHRYYFEYLPDPKMPRMLHLRHVWWPAVKACILGMFT